MVYTQDFDELLKTHIESEADITVLYHAVDNAKDAYQNCYCVNLNKQKGVTSFELNRGTAKNRNIFMDTYVMKKEVFIDLLKEAQKTSSMYTLRMIVNAMKWIFAVWHTEAFSHRLQISRATTMPIWLW